MATIEHEFTDEIVCPFCGYEHGDSWEVSPGNEVFTDSCAGCEREFRVTRMIEVTYSTEPLEDAGDD